MFAGDDVAEVASSVDDELRLGDDLGDGLVDLDLLVGGDLGDGVFDAFHFGVRELEREVVDRDDRSGLGVGLEAGGAADGLPLLLQVPVRLPHKHRVRIFQIQPLPARRREQEHAHLAGVVALDDFRSFTLRLFPRIELVRDLQLLEFVGDGVEAGRQIV